MAMHLQIVVQLPSEKFFAANGEIWRENQLRFISNDVQLNVFSSGFFGILLLEWTGKLMSL